MQSPRPGPPPSRRPVPSPQVQVQQPPEQRSDGRSDKTKYTVLTAKVLVETEEMTQTEHDRVVQWAINKVKTSIGFAQRGFVMVVVYDETGKNVLGSDSAGTKPVDSETGQIMADFFNVNDVA